MKYEVSRLLELGKVGVAMPTIFWVLLGIAQSTGENPKSKIVGHLRKSHIILFFDLAVQRAKLW